MMSLKAKVITALLGTSFAAVGLFRLTARGMIHSRFDDMVFDMGLSADMGLGSFEEILAAADQQLYRAKGSGRDRVCY